MISFEEAKLLLEKRGLDEGFSAVYPKKDFDLHYERYQAVLKSFGELFGENRQVGLFSAPGRTEVGGNHTDHNHGKVLAASVSLDAIAVASPSENGIVRIKSQGYDMDTVDCSELSPRMCEEGKSQALVRGVLDRFSQLGYKIGGFDAATASSVLSGSGLSSSAAFEVLVGTILNHLYNDGKISPVEIAKIAQYAENVHFKKPCGLLDQTACSVGSFVTVDFNDPSEPVIKKVDFDLASSGYSLCIVDTGKSHSDLTDEYASVRSEMESVAAFFQKKVLREINKSDVIENAAKLSEALGERAVLRALHFFGENERVEKQVEALEKKDMEGFNKLIVESGRSSYMYNQNVFSCADAKSQPLSLALLLSEELLSKRGAWRVHGGGFAGTIQAFVPDELLEKYTSSMKALFGEKCCHVLSIRPVGGAKII